MFGFGYYYDIISCVMGENLPWQTEMKVQKAHYQIFASRKLKWNLEMKRDIIQQSMQCIDKMLYRSLQFLTNNDNRFCFHIQHNWL